jgi:hypothetical protein
MVYTQYTADSSELHFIVLRLYSKPEEAKYCTEPVRTAKHRYLDKA